MTKVLWHVTMSLDGFIAPPDDSVEWMFGHGSAGPIGQEIMTRTSAILAGRRGFDLGNQPGATPRGIYGGAWSGPLFVLTHRPGQHRPGLAPDGVTFLSAGIHDAVATAVKAAGDGDV